MAYLYELIQNVPGLSGNHPKGKQGELYDKLGAPLGEYTASLEQNNWLVNQINSGNYGGQAQAPQVPTSPAGVPGYIDYLQNTRLEDLALEDSPFADAVNRTDEQIQQEINQSVTPTLVRPDPVNLTSTYDQMRNQYNLDALEQQLNDISTQIDTEMLNVNKGRALERGKPVALNVIEGRISERDRIQTEKIQDLGLIRDSLVRYVDSANSVIGLRMNLLKEDYDIAKEAYDSEFQQRVTTYQLFSQEKQARDDLRFKIIQDERARASANLQMYIDLISKGQLTFNNLSAEQQIEVGKLEMLAGLPRGFMSTIKMEPGADIKSITTREVNGQQWADIIRINPQTGALEVESKFIGNVNPPSYMYGGSSSTKMTEAETQRTASSEMATWLRTGSAGGVQNMGQDGKVNPEAFKSGLGAWQSQGFSVDSYYQQFSNLVNSSHWWDYMSKNEAEKYLGIR